MRLGRIASPDGVAFVAIEGDDGDARAREIAEHPFGAPTFTGRSWPLSDVRLLAPILASKVVCIGKNYAAHVAEMGGEAPADPVIFIKPNTSALMLWHAMFPECFQKAPLRWLYVDLFSTVDA